jgi:hypothetical protein
MSEKKCICNEPYDSERHEGGYPYCPVHDKKLAIIGHGSPSADALAIADYEEVLADHKRLVRELDVYLNGEYAADQATLGDMVKQVKHIWDKVGQPGAVWIKDQYDKLYDQVKEGKQTVCYVDYTVFGSDKVYRDVCTIKAETMEFVSRGHGYGSVRYMSGNEKELFIQLCESIHVEWLCEGAAAGREPDIDELWDEHSELIDDDIDSLTRWAGSTVVDKEQFRKLVERMWDYFKQQNEK